ncbi:phosphotransferase [Yinghuangia aomiensis]
MVLTADDVPGYVAGRPTLRGLVDADTLTVTEVGDGNLNLVFICVDAAGRRVVLKQALPYVRLVGPEWPMTELRAAREGVGAHRARRAVRARVQASRLRRGAQRPGARRPVRPRGVPLPAQRGRRARRHRGAAERICRRRRLRHVLPRAHRGGVPAARRARRTRSCARSAKPWCSPQPFLGAERNSVRPSVAPLLAGLQADAAWVAAALEMKRAFLTRQEMLVHGDLHTGSVFVRGSGDGVSVKAFDSEFACYAPIGFDLGMLWANLVFAGMRAAVLGDDARADALFGSVETSWRVFAARFAAHWPERRDPAGCPDVFLDGWLTAILRDCFGFAGCEAARRTVGLAKVSDVETLDVAPYTAAASAMLRLSRTLLVGRAALGAEDVAGLCRKALGAAG